MRFRRRLDLPKEKMTWLSWWPVWGTAVLFIILIAVVIIFPKG